MRFNRFLSVKKVHHYCQIVQNRTFSGEPLDRVPHAKTIHRIVLAPLLIFKTIRVFAVCGLRPRLCLWKPPPFEKGGRKLLFLCTFICEIGFPTSKPTLRNMQGRFYNYYSVKLFFRFSVHQLSAHDNAHNRRHHKAARPAARIAQTVQSLNACVEVFVHFHAVRVKLQLGRIQQCFG